MTNIAFAFTPDIKYTGRAQKIIFSLLKLRDVNIVLYDMYNGESSELFKNNDIVNHKKTCRYSKHKIINFLRTLFYSIHIGHCVAKSRKSHMICYDVTLLLAGYIAKKINPDLFLIYDCNELSLESMKDQNKLKLLFFHYVLKKTIPFCDIIIQVDEYRGKYLQEKYPFEPNKQVMIKNYPNKNSVKLNYSTNRHAFKSVYFGNIMADREVESLIKVFKGIDAKYTLDIIGKGDPVYINKLQKSIKGYKSRIQLLPPIPQNKIFEVLGQYSIGFLFYRPDNLNQLYCAPSKLYEYLFSRLCVISYCSPSIKSLIVDNKIGVCIDEINEFNIQKAIDTISDEKYYNNITEDLLNTLIWEKQEKELLNIFSA